MPFDERDRLLDHVLDVDQHVRYALILQAGIGMMLAALLGYLPGGDGLALAAALLCGGWLVLVEFTHRLRKRASGRMLASIDMSVRYALMAALAAAAVAALGGALALPTWLALKLALFAGVIACGLGIRWSIIRYYRDWAALEREGSSVALESRLQRRYWQATTILIGLWVLIGGIVALSVAKPF